MREIKSRLGKILKGSLDVIPSPSSSVKIQIMAWGAKAKHYWTLLLNTYKKCDDITQQCFALFPQVTFPANNLDFHWIWRWLDQIQAIFLNLFYFNNDLLNTIPNLTYSIFALCITFRNIFSIQTYCCLISWTVFWTLWFWCPSWHFCCCSHLPPLAKCGRKVYHTNGQCNQNIFGAKHNTRFKNLPIN